MDFSFLFNQRSYKDKINSVTYLRFLCWLIWKFFLIIIIIMILSLVSKIPFFQIFFKFNFSFVILLKFYLISVLCDIVLLIMFKGETGIMSQFEKISKIFLEPNQISFCFFALIVLVIFSLKTMKQMVNINEINYFPDEEEIENQKDSVFYWMMSFYLIFEIISSVSRFKWKEINTNRIDCFKQNLKNIFIRDKNYFSVELKIIIIFLILVFTKKSIFIWKNFIVFTNIYLFVDFMLFLSFEIIKNFICSNINYGNLQTPTANSLIKYPLNFKIENNLINIHYFKNLNYIFINGIYCNSNNTPSSSNLKLINKENFEEIKKKLDYLYNKLIEKLKYSNDQNLQVIRFFFFKYLDFSKNEIFERETSLQMIDLATELMYNVIIFFIQNNNKNIIQNFQFYIVHFFELLTFYEKITKDISTSTNFYSNMISHENLQNELVILNKKIELKLQHLIKYNQEHNYLLEQSSSVRDRLTLFNCL